MKKYSDSVAVEASLAFSPRIAKIDVFYVKIGSKVRFFT